MRERDLQVLVEAMPYIRKFRDRLFIVKLGGELLEDPEHLSAVAGDITLARMVGIRVVVVHGGGPQASRMSTTLGHEPQMVGGRRVTDEATLEVAKMVFAGQLNTDLLSQLHRHGGRGVGVSGVDGGLIDARRRPKTRVVEDGLEREVDYGFVGDIVAVDPTLLLNLVENNFIPVVSSLGADPEGTILNINADTIASEIAIAMQAAKLVVMTSVEGVRRDGTVEGGIFSVLHGREIDRLVSEGIVTKGMRPKLAACRRAVESGVGEAHIINGLAPHSLLEEIFTDEGAGTMILADDPRG